MQLELESCLLDKRWQILRFASKPPSVGAPEGTHRKGDGCRQIQGRPVSIDAAQIRQLRAELGPAAIAKRLGIARSSVYRVLGA